MVIQWQAHAFAYGKVLANGDTKKPIAEKTWGSALPQLVFSGYLSADIVTIPAVCIKRKELLASKTL